MNPGNVGDGIVSTWYPAPYRAPRRVESTVVLPSPPVPEMTIANGAGLSCDENQTRRSRPNQRTSGTGRAQGMCKLISTSGTLAGMGAISCGGVPYTVARSAAESANPVAGSGAPGDAMS